MRKFFFAAGCAALMALTGCQSGTSPGGNTTPATYTNQVLPATLSVKVPESLLLSTTAGKSFGSAKSAASKGSGIQSAGYSMVQEMTGMMQSLVPATVMMGVIVDAVISQNNLAPGTYKNQSVTLTQAMYNTIAAQLPAEETASAEHAIGQTVTISAVTYSIGGSGSLPNSASVTLNSGTTSSEKINYKWSSDRKSVQMSIPADSMTLTIAYDGNDGSGAFGLVMTGLGSFQMSLAPDSTSKADGASVSMTETGSENTYSVYGYADDNGGIVNTAIGSTTSTWYWEEGFDGTGTLIFQADSTSSLTAVVDSYVSTSAAMTESACKTAYGSKASAASSFSGGATSLLSE